MGGTCKPCGCGEDKTTFNSYDRGKTIIDISQSKADALKFLKNEFDNKNNDDNNIKTINSLLSINDYFKIVMIQSFYRKMMKKKILNNNSLVNKNLIKNEKNGINKNNKTILSNITEESGDLLVYNIIDDKITYTGYLNCNKNTFSQLGVLKIGSDEIYHGQFLDGYYNGYGLNTRRDVFSYEGEFVNGLKHGIGIEILENNEVYVGEYKYDFKDGIGIYYFSNGARYEGEFKKGIITGYVSIF
jgi:hypothetical protein